MCIFDIDTPTKYREVTIKNDIISNKTIGIQSSKITHKWRVHYTYYQNQILDVNYVRENVLKILKILFVTKFLFYFIDFF